MNTKSVVLDYCKIPHEPLSICKIDGYCGYEFSTEQKESVMKNLEGWMHTFAEEAKKNAESSSKYNRC
jgi:hypothetical protein